MRMRFSLVIHVFALAALAMFVIGCGGGSSQLAGRHIREDCDFCVLHLYSDGQFSLNEPSEIGGGLSHSHGKCQLESGKVELYAEVFNDVKVGGNYSVKTLEQQSGDLVVKSLYYGMGEIWIRE